MNVESDLYGIFRYQSRDFFWPFDEDQIAGILQQLCEPKNFKLVRAFETIRINMDESCEFLSLQCIYFFDNERWTCDVFFDAEFLSHGLCERGFPGAEITREGYDGRAGAGPYSLNETCRENV